jgi:outer membrane protein assembly factor BamB
LSFAAPLAAVENAGEWHYYRGPTHNSVVSEPLAWPANGPKQLWKAAIGDGYSSMSVSGGKVFAMGNDGAKDTVYCFDAETGKEIWKQSYACETPKSFPGPRATPTIDGDKLFTFSRKGTLYCWEAATGKRIWESNLPTETGATPPNRDFSGSPLIQGNALFLNVGSNGCALDKYTGKLLWKSGTDVSGYSTPVAYDAGGGKQLLTLFSATALMGISPADGKVQWTYPRPTHNGVNAVDPLVVGNKVFGSTAYNVGSMLIELGAAEPKLLWKNAAIQCHTSNPVFVNGHLYLFNGNQNSPGALQCVDFETGKVLWSKEPFMGTVLTDGSKLLILTVKGELVLVEADAKAYKEIARAQVMGGQCWTIPVLTGGKLFARNAAGDLVCVGMK